MLFHIICVILETSCTRSLGKKCQNQNFKIFKISHFVFLSDKYSDKYVFLITPKNESF
jgi:hypothetical protein